MSRFTHTGRDWTAPTGGVTQWQRERAYGRVQPLTRSLFTRAALPSWAACLIVAAVFALGVML